MTQLRDVVRCRLKYKQDPNSWRCQHCSNKFFCFTNGKLIANGINAECRYTFEVPNTQEGQDFIKLCRKFLNRENWDMKPRGRNNNRKDLPHTNFCGDVKLKDAEWFAVYFNTKNFKFGDVNEDFFKT